MKWRSLSSRDLHPAHWIWLWAPLVVMLLFLGPLLAIEWLEQKKRKLMGPTAEWRPWLAWFPVRFEFTDQAVWLEWVERRRQYDWTDHRPVGAPGDCVPE